MKATVLVVLVSLVVSTVAAEQFIVTDLGTLGGDASRAYGLNIYGQVVGWAYTSEGYQRAFIWTDSSMVGLNSLSGFPWDIARGVNAGGQIVGISGPKGSPSIVLWDGNTIQVIWPGSTSAYGINDNVQVVGKKGGDPGDPFLWQNGVLVNFAGTRGAAYAINDCGQIVGYLGSGSNSIFLYSNNTIFDLGPGEAYGLNDNPNVQVVGHSNTTGQAFLWQSGVMQYLGLGTAYGINDSGQVVGCAGYAFLWQNGLLQDLNDLIKPGLGWTLIEATAINDVGQIVGWGSHNGQERAFLLTPIPEPASLCLFAAGLGLFWPRRR